MTDSERLTETVQHLDETQWIVYMLDQNAKVMPYFLAVCESADEAKEEMEKWWKAFENGEKTKPEFYGGLSFGPVSDFERWSDE